MTSLISVRNLSKIFHTPTEHRVLNQVTVLLEQARSYTIMGPSGSGKSTLIHIIAGLEEPTSGSILFNNQSVHECTQIQRAQILRKHIGLVFQQPHLIAELNVIENVMLKGFLLGMPRSECIKQAQGLLAQVGLSGAGDYMPSELSGGQQQRVALARALFTQPDFLFADEPTGNLDAQTRADILKLLISCQRIWGMGLVISSHDEAIAQQLETTFYLSNGTLATVKSYQHQMYNETLAQEQQQ